MVDSTSRQNDSDFLSKLTRLSRTEQTDYEAGRLRHESLPIILDSEMPHDDDVIEENFRFFPRPHAVFPFDPSHDHFKPENDYASEIFPEILQTYDDAAAVPTSESQRYPFMLRKQKPYTETAENPWMDAFSLLSQRPLSDGILFQGLHARQTSQTRFDLRLYPNRLNKTQRETLFVSTDVHQFHRFWATVASQRKAQADQIPSAAAISTDAHPSSSSTATRLENEQDVFFETIKLMTSAWNSTLKILWYCGIIQVAKRHSVIVGFRVIDEDRCMRWFNVFFTVFANQQRYEANSYLAVAYHLQYEWIHGLQWAVDVQESRESLRQNVNLNSRYDFDPSRDYIVPFPDSFQRGMHFSAVDPARKRIGFFMPKQRSIYYVLGDPNQTELNIHYSSHTFKSGSPNAFMVLPWYHLNEVTLQDLLSSQA